MTTNTITKEITLKEIIMSILKNKLLIIIITVVFLLGSIIFTQFIKNDEYESTRSLLDYSDNFDKNFYMLTSQLTQPEVLSLTLEELENRYDDKYDYLNYKKLAKKISFLANEGSNLLEITIEDRKLLNSEEILDVYISVYIKYVMYYQESVLNKSLEALEEQLLTVEQDIIRNNAIIIEYEQNNENLDILLAETNTLKEEINDYRKLLRETGTSIKLRKAELISLYDLAEENNISLDHVIDFNLTIGEDEVITVNSVDNTQNLLGAMIISDIVNSETDYLLLLAQFTAYDEMLVELDELHLSKTIAYYTSRTEYNKILMDYTMQTNMQMQLQDKLINALTNQVTHEGVSNIELSTTDSKSLLIEDVGDFIYWAFAIILGLIVGVMIALFKEYWLRS